MIGVSFRMRTAFQCQAKFDFHKRNAGHREQSWRHRFDPGQCRDIAAREIAQHAVIQQIRHRRCAVASGSVGTACRLSR